MTKGIGYVFGIFIGVPMIVLVINFFFFRGNQVTNNQVLQYIHESKIIEVIIPSEAPLEYKIYYPKLTIGNNTKIYNQNNFYSMQYGKYFTLITFGGFDFSWHYGKDKQYVRIDVIRRGGYFTVFANEKQWNDPTYGVRENPMPIFGIKVVKNLGGIKLEDDSYEKRAFDISEKINSIFVEQYLNYFLSEKELSRLFENMSIKE